MGRWVLLLLLGGLGGTCFSVVWGFSLEGILGGGCCLARGGGFGRVLCLVLVCVSSEVMWDACLVISCPCLARWEVSMSRSVVCVCVHVCVYVYKGVVVNNVAGH